MCVRVASRPTDRNRFFFEPFFTVSLVFPIIKELIPDVADCQGSRARTNLLGFAQSI